MHHADHVRALGPALDAKRTLSRRRQAFFGRQDCSDALGKTQPLEPRCRQNDGRIISGVELIEPRLDITAQWVDREWRETRSNLAFTPQARSADATAGGQRA